MVKGELKTGMIITNRKGNKYMVFKNFECEARYGDALVMLDGREWSHLGNYNEDMTHNGFATLDIMKVEKCLTTTDLMNPNRHTTTIWERKEKKTYTYAQLREILGSEFEVVG